MCGRFLLIAPVEALRRLFGAQGAPNLAARWNIAPTQSSAVVRAEAGGGRELVALRWGLIASWVKDPGVGSHPINARADGVAAKPSFRAAFRARRCLVPADGFYEWQAGPPRRPKQPYLIVRPERGTFAFAGLWERWESGGQVRETFAIVTTEANATLKPIHRRMPAVLRSQDWTAWLDPANAGARSLLKPAPEDFFAAVAVSAYVNNVRNDDAGCLVPATVAPDETPPATGPPAAAIARPRAQPDALPAQGRLF